jgi:2-phospho-L-lactate guanylyltransferase
MDAGLLPVKRLDRAKQRLAPAFGTDERLQITTALLEDALALCRGTPFLSWWVVSDDPAVLERARGLGLGAVSDDGSGLNAALAAGIAAATAAGATSITVVPADVPLAHPEDIRDVVDTGATSDVVLAPALRDGGTNALHLRPPDALEPSFGPASLPRHLEEAQEKGLRCSILHRPRLALDLDTPEDAEELLDQAESNSRTAALLAHLRGRKARSEHSPDPGGSAR